MNLIWLVILITIISTVLIIILNNNKYTIISIPKSKLLQSISLNNEQNKLLKCLEKSPYTMDQLLNIEIKELLATESGQKNSCVRRGYGFTCAEMGCKCTIKNRDQCDIYANELSNPTYYSSEEIKENLDNNVYWDDSQQSCIVVPKSIQDGLCATKGIDINEEEVLGKIDRETKGHNFEFVRPTLSCNKMKEVCRDGKTCGYSCDYIKFPTCKIPKSYCNVKGMDYTDRNDGDCVVSSGQEMAELFFGETLVRCAKTGDWRCVGESLDIVAAVTDVVCKYAFGKENGCGFSLLGDFVYNTAEGIKIMYEGLEKGWDATSNFLTDTLPDFLLETLPDWFEGDFVDFWTETLPDSFEYVWDKTEQAFKDFGNMVYDDVLVPVANWVTDKVLGC